jgi:LysR family transcriptional regulator, glycine cleavage system transcriptional activator
MLEKLPPLASIRAFEAAARLGSFAKAAAELGTTSASVSYHVRQLERELGVPLFLRHAQRVTLTEHGQSIAPELTALFASLQTTLADVVDAYEARLSLTTLPTFGASWLTPRLGRFRKLHEGIRVELDLSESPRELGAGAFDAAVRNGHGKWAGLRATKLFASMFMPLCSPALKGAAKSIADPRRKPAAPLLGRQDWWRRWYEALGVRADLEGRFGTTLQAEYLDAAAAMAGQGVTIGSPILFADEIASGRLVPAHDFVAADGRAFWFVYPAVRAKSRKIMAFRDWIVAEAEQAAANALSAR